MAEFCQRGRTGNAVAADYEWATTQRSMATSAEGGQMNERSMGWGRHLAPLTGFMQLPMKRHRRKDPARWAVWVLTGSTTHEATDLPDSKLN